MLHKFILVILITIIFKISYICTLEIKNDLLAHSFGNHRTKRQGDNQICATPNIVNGKVKILSQKLSYLLLNVTCDYNFILYPPNNNIILCVHGIWDQEIPQCIQCGQRLDNTHKPFIVNGTLSKFGDFPWHVGIYEKKTSNSHPLYLCGGSIINDNTILSVAHCFTDESGKSTSGEYYIAAGKYYSSYNSDKDKYAQKRKVVRIDIHPRYKGYFTNYAWDIAVIIVDEPFEISNLVQPVCVDWMTDFENEQLIPNNYGEIAGWGSTETNVDTASQELRVLKVPFIKAERCANLVPNTFIRYITPDKFCAGYTNGSSVCGGDSGGGLVFQREENLDNRFYIRGLVSVGVQIDGRCDDYKYSTYTKVSEYLSFIRESISKKVIATTPSSVSTTTKTPTNLIDANVPCLTPNLEYAKCISINECQIFVDALQSNPTTETQKFMNDSQCGAEEGIKVCCGSTINSLSFIPNSDPVSTSTNTPTNLIDANVLCLTPNLEYAKCISINECQIFVDALQNNPTSETRKFMRDSQCGAEEGIKVCCGSTINSLSIIPNSDPVTSTGLPSFSGVPFDTILPPSDSLLTPSDSLLPPSDSLLPPPGGAEEGLNVCCGSTINSWSIIPNSDTVTSISTSTDLPPSSSVPFHTIL